MVYWLAGWLTGDKPPVHWRQGLADKVPNPSRQSEECQAAASWIPSCTCKIHGKFFIVTKSFAHTMKISYCLLSRILAVTAGSFVIDKNQNNGIRTMF